MQNNQNKELKKQKRASQKETVLRVLQYLGGYRFILILSLLLAAGSVAMTLYIPKLTGQAVDFMIDAHKVDFDGVKGILLKILICALATGLFQWIMNLCNNRMTFRIVRDIRNEAIHKIEHLPLKYIDGHPSGEIVSRVIADVDQFADGLLMGFTQLFTGVATIVGTFVFMLTVNVWITLVVVLITPVSLFVAAFISRRTYKMFRLQSETRGEETAYINEMITGQKVVKAFGRQDASREKFCEINRRLRDSSLQATFFSSLTNPCTRFVNSLVYTGVGIFGALSVIAGRMSVGQLSSFLSYANQYTKPFNEISGVVTELQNAIACALRIFDLIDEASEPADAVDASVPTEYRAETELDHVSFSYVPEQHLIEDFRLKVQPGQRVAIVGPTGCGKTTLINLLMRFYDVTDGAIYLDGTDIRKIQRNALRGGFGMVLQETWLRTGTVRENITMGNPEISEEEMIRAAKTCHADSFIKRLPHGYDTVLTGDGAGLSQGQKQLLCITRVMLAHPSMLILDEATSSIDTRTELKIQDAFNELMKGHTSFIVAHRLSTIREADVILVMKDGHIIEQGSHNELMKQGGFYSTLYQSQFLGKAI